MPPVASIPRPRGQSDWLTVAAVLLIALAGVMLRLGYRDAAYRRDPLQGAPLLDTGAYDADARAMLAGDLFEPAVHYRPPGYPWFLAGVRSVGGAPRTVTTIQAWLDGASALLLAGLAWRLSRRRWWAVAAVSLHSFQPLYIYYSAERLETTWVVLWVVLHLWSLVLALERGSAARWSLAGASLGIAALVRPNLLLWAPFLALGAWRRDGLRAGLAGLCACLVLILPVTVKTYLRSGQHVLVSANGGVNLWLGNVPDPEIHGPFPCYEHLPGPVAGWSWELVRRRASDAGARELDEESRWFAREAARQMLAHPGRTLRLFVEKSVALLGRVELSNNRDVYREGSPLCFPGAWLFSWAVLLPLALAGVRSVRRSPDSHGRWIASFALVLALSVVLFFVSGRHRAVLLPPLTLLSLFGLDACYRMIRARAPDRIAVGLLAVGVLVAAPDWLGHRRLYRDYEIDPVGVGNLWVELGNPEEAEAAYGRALARIPDDPLALGNLAALRLEQGRLPEAEALLRRSVAKAEDRADSQGRLGLTLFLLDQPAEALAHLDRAVELDPLRGLAWMNRGRVLHALGRLDEAVRSLERARELLGDHPAVPRLTALLAEIRAGR